VDADAIVVLGCRVDNAGLPSERMRRRMALAVALYRDGAAPLIVLSGGGLGPVAEAAAMRDLALAAKRGDTVRFAGAPHYAPRRRLDEPRAARIPILKWTKSGA